jgi:hypothetical protein
MKKKKKIRYIWRFFHHFNILSSLVDQWTLCILIAESYKQNKKDFSLSFLFLLLYLKYLIIQPICEVIQIHSSFSLLYWIQIKFLPVVFVIPTMIHIWEHLTASNNIGCFFLSSNSFDWSACTKTEKRSSCIFVIGVLAFGTVLTVWYFYVY